MSIKLRLAKLEASLMPEPTNHHIIRMIIDTDDRKVIGYQCQDIAVYKMDDESEGEYKARLSQSVEWPEGKSSRHVFTPIYENC